MSAAPNYSEYARRLKASDREAFAALFRLLREPLIRYVLTIVREDMVAHDMVQDCFVALWNLRETLDPNKSLKAYMYQMVRRRALRHLRDTRLHEKKRALIQQRSSSEIPVDQWPDAAMESDSLSSNLKRWLSALPGRQREALELSRYQGLSYKEIAEVMDISPRTVNTHISLAIRNLRRTIETDEMVLMQL
ncbi:MAG: RNA polymerase sigma-70 factor [Rhodothermaceae bacterium]|nr:RNA polymerase sigma-70 factor [Rhodothermaceae bacterium]